jgi:hypothetical protein
MNVRTHDRALGRIEGMELNASKWAIWVLAFSLIVLLPIPNSYAKAISYKNCTALNKVYPGGVALPGAVNKGGLTRYEPTFNRALYNANKKSDRDKDGIACEK